MRVLLDPAVVAAVVSEASHLDAPTVGSDRALSVRTISPTLLDAVVRLVHLADTPRDARISTAPSTSRAFPRSWG
jgi:hypothetical protein